MAIRSAQELFERECMQEKNNWDSYDFFFQLFFHHIYLAFFSRGDVLSNWQKMGLFGGCTQIMFSFHPLLKTHS